MGNGSLYIIPLRDAITVALIREFLSRELVNYYSPIHHLTFIPVFNTMRNTY